MRNARNALHAKRRDDPFRFPYVPVFFFGALAEIETEANTRLDQLEVTLKAMVAQARLEANLDYIANN